ncbi:GNAT family N-acetyltransferase [Anaeromyxobacter paludicola]|uniref:BioF2-like acetyltransferase domain-containing protein n=1 Tax=Anaeromyxobacter paludicola TaxID=2918171 RepID=A0ABM7X9P1_9BACT|nr:GNAT family N-acetyltransferase [Anaeromyxobacter paludicola]BDG08530.1 hypothetical protein AMPC_16430 [Anaeromyxobacter paludicola]
MRFRVLDAASGADTAAWLELWRAWPGREVMAHPEYARLFARPGDRVVCATGEGEGWTILFPLLLRPLAAEPWARPGEDRWDAVTPYGYGGPFTWGGGARDDAAWWAAHAAWCRDERLVSTFARLSLFPEQLASVPPVVERRLSNVICPVGEGLQAVWAGYKHSARNNVKHAEKAGVEVEVDETGAGLDAFFDIYHRTMSRRAASAWYFLPRRFFQDFFERLPGQCAFFHARLGGQIVSSELVLVSAENVYAYLGGTLEESFKARPNDLLRHRVVEWAVAKGKRHYVLGGGYAEGDGIFRHKEGFAPHGVVPFQVACLVHDERACEELYRDRRAFAERSGAPWTPDERFFPAYRG